MQKKYYHVLTYGCQMNENDSERLAGQLETIGYLYTKDMTEASFILVNTCCVRESAENKILGKLGELKHYKAHNPNLIIAVVGCMAQKEGDRIIQRAPHVDIVMGTHVHNLVELVAALEKEKHLVQIQDDLHIEQDVNPIRKSSVYAWVPIMYGCNNFCTYCIVPYVRGREVSRLPSDIIEEVTQLTKQGYKEITLLGQNVNSYGKKFLGTEVSPKCDFADLLQKIDKIEGIERIRYMTSHPRDITDKLIDTIANSHHICEHFHLPIQSGSNAILKKMNRGYTRESYLELVRKIRTKIPAASITTDIIIGFPGETEEYFEETLDLVKEVHFDAAFTFLYSKRSGTPAAELPEQIPLKQKKARIQQLLTIQNDICLAVNKKLEGQSLEVMVEGVSKNNDDIWTGRTRTNKLVLWPYKGFEAPGQFVNIHILHAQSFLLKGELING